MRLFTAVELPPAIEQDVATVLAELQRRAAHQSPHARVTWVPAERLHLTLRFIGHADEPLAGRIVAALTPPIAIESFRVAVEGTGAFPPRGRPRVLWAGVGEGRDGLLSVAKAIGARLQPLGVEDEEREYRPHLTLARVRDGTGLRTASLLDGLVTRRFGTFTIEAITLFDSRLSSKGPDYVALQRIPLGT